MQQYSLKKGLFKGAISLLSILGAAVAFTTFADMPLTEMITKYIFPLLGSLTFGGLITVLINWLKFQTTN